MEKIHLNLPISYFRNFIFHLNFQKKLNFIFPNSCSPVWNLAITHLIVRLLLKLSNKLKHVKQNYKTKLTIQSHVFMYLLLRIFLTWNLILFDIFPFLRFSYFFFFKNSRKKLKNCLDVFEYSSCISLFHENNYINSFVVSNTILCENSLKIHVHISWEIRFLLRSLSLRIVRFERKWFLIFALNPQFLVYLFSLFNDTNFPKYDFKSTFHLVWTAI